MRYLGQRLHATTSTRRRRRYPLRDLPVRRPSSATASSSPARWRCCCGWAACRPGSPPASPPARYDRPTHAAGVVSDLDAHAWVEAWFPRYGWVTFDPTPAAAPARGGHDRRAACGDGSPASERGRAGSAGLARPRQPAAAAPTTTARRRRVDRVLLGDRSACWRCCWRWRCSRWTPDRRSSTGERAARRARAGARAQRAPDRRRRHAGRARAPLPHLAGGGRATCARCGWPASAGADELPTLGAAPRAAARSSAPGSGSAGRLRALWALPPRSTRARGATGADPAA